MSTTQKPELLLLCLSMQSFLDDSYASLFNNLHKHATIKRAKTYDGALRYLAANNPKIMLITDEGLMKEDNAPVLEAVKAYLHNGGLAIAGLHFPCFIDMDMFDRFFAKFGLPWKHGDYHRSTFQFSPLSALPAGVNPRSLPATFSMKVLYVKYALLNEKIFIPVPNSTTQSMVFPAAQVDQAQAAMVGARIGSGYLAYIGDVNSESDEVISALCGFRST